MKSVLIRERSEQLAGYYDFRVEGGLSFGCRSTGQSSSMRRPVVSVHKEKKKWRL
jgi:hypothetical protein